MNEVEKANMGHFMQTLKDMGVTKFAIEFDQGKELMRLAPPDPTTVNAAEPVEKPMMELVTNSKPEVKPDAVAEKAAERDPNAHLDAEKRVATAAAAQVEKDEPATKATKKAEDEAKAAAALAKRQAKKDERAQGRKDAAAEKKANELAEAGDVSGAETKEVDHTYKHFITLTELDDGDVNGNDLRKACLSGMSLDDLTTINNDFGLGADMDLPLAKVREEIIDCFTV